MYTTLDGRRTSLEDFVDSHLHDSHVLYIGTDSKNTSRTKFSTCLVAYKKGRGGVLLKRIRHERKIASLGDRLIREAWYSVEMALELGPLLPRQVEVEIHLDVNADLRHKSARHLPAMVGLVAAQGFAYRVKPDAWCATFIADKVVKSNAP